MGNQPHTGGLGRNPHGDVEALFDGVDAAIVEHQLHVQVGVQGHKLHQQRGKVQGAKGHRRVDAQAATGLLVQAGERQFGGF